MDERYQAISDLLIERFQVEPSEFRGEIVFKLDPAQIKAAAKCLHDELGFNHLVDVTAVDYWPREGPRFHVVYHIRNTSQNLIICLRVPLSGNFPELDTVEQDYPGANWYEREVFDMFGINFIGHSDLRRIMMPHDWVGHPLRKDYPLGYEEVQFTFNADEITARKLKPGA